MEPLSERLKTAREKLRYTQQQVADAVGVSQRSYSMYEEGIRNPKIATLDKLKRVLKLEQSENEETSIEDKIKQLSSLTSVLAAEVAGLKSKETNEPIQLIVMKIYKAAGDISENS